MRLSEAILESWKPQLIVYDCLPNLPFSGAARKRGIRCAFCIRQVRNFKTYVDDPRVKSAISDAQVLIVPHFAATFSLPRQFRNKTVYVGDVVRPRGSAGARATWKIGPGKRMVIIIGGGGGHVQTVDYYNLVLRSLNAVISKHDDIYALLVTGPLFREWSQLSLLGRVHVSPFEPELDDLFSKAALVISQGGYNSMVELTVLDVPAICLPQPRAFDDQIQRAEAFSRENDNFRLYRGANSDELANLIEWCLERGRVCGKRTSTSRAEGALLAAKALLKLLEQ
jgi:predicted glycosyltransferase